MTGGPMQTTATIIPALRYHDAPAAIDWLCRAFGFERHLVVPGEGGTIVHAQLTFGNGMIMLGSGPRDDDYNRLIVAPADAGGVTQAPYIVVDDADAHYARATAAGAEILMDIADWEHGGRGIHAATPKATSGTSAPTTRGRRTAPRPTPEHGPRPSTSSG